MGAISGRGSKISHGAQKKIHIRLKMVKKSHEKMFNIANFLEKCKSKLQYHLTPARMAISKKNPQAINTGECVERKEPSYTVGGNINWYSHY